MLDTDKIVIFRSKNNLMIKYVDYNDGIYDDDKSILYMTSKNDSEESFEFMVQKSNDELIDFVKNLYNEPLIQDLDKCYDLSNLDVSQIDNFDNIFER